MKYMAKYSRVYWDDDVKPTQKQCQQTLCTEELCSISDKDNYSLSQNTHSQTNIITKGFFQTVAQKALQNSQIDEAFEIVGQYIEATKENSFGFLMSKQEKLLL